MQTKMREWCIAFCEPTVSGLILRLWFLATIAGLAALLGATK